MDISPKFILLPPELIYQLVKFFPYGPTKTLLQKANEKVVESHQPNDSASTLLVFLLEHNKCLNNRIDQGAVMVRLIRHVRGSLDWRMSYAQQLSTNIYTAVSGVLDATDDNYIQNVRRVIRIWFFIVTGMQIGNANEEALFNGAIRFQEYYPMFSIHGIRTFREAHDECNNVDNHVFDQSIVVTLREGIEMAALI